MTNVQLYLAMGVPSFVTLVGIVVNVSLYIHLSSVMNARFESVERRLELIQGDTHQMDIRLTRLEAR